MASRAERLQKAAYDAHVRGREAIEVGDVTGAFVNDDESDVLAVEAMLERMRDRAARDE